MQLVLPNGGSLKVCDSLYNVLDYVHPVDDVYNVEIEAGHKFNLLFDSIDTLFARSSQFTLTAHANGTTTLQQYVPALHESLTGQLPSISSENGTIVVERKMFYIGRATLDMYRDKSGGLRTLITSIPGLQRILDNKWLSIVFAAMVFFAMLPVVIPYIDPDFGRRLAEAQREAEELAAKDAETEESSKTQ